MMPTTTSTCPSCGGAVLPGDRFCGSCGATVVITLPHGTQSSASPAAGAPAGKVDPIGDASPWGVVAARLQAATLGEFEILSELGRGGMAAVYLARDLALNRRVAIKVMSPGLLLGPGMVERFRQEAVTVANLQHAHIVAIHAVRQLEDLHFFVMQFVPGRTLEGVLREVGALPIAVVRAWLYQVGSALGYAHRRGVIHRDIKPGNILLNADGEAIVTDFGIAKVAETPSHTQTGTVVGTPVYMSPEQCFAKELTGASDQYSLGVVAYEMLAGRTPFSGSSFALMRAHTDDAPPPLADMRADVPPAMNAALMRMLAKRPEERFATLGEALVSLGATPLSPDDPLHVTLRDLAAAKERLEQLGDVLRTPASPVPKTREAVRPDAPRDVTPRTPVPATQALVIVVASPPADLEPGASVPLRASVKNAMGLPVPDAQVRWSSSASSVAMVDDSTGVLRALGSGTATITAAAGTAHDSVDVVVGEPRPATVAITVPPGTIHVGDRVTVSAVVTTRFGVRLVRPVDWSVEDPEVVVLEPAAAGASPMAATLRAAGSGVAGVIGTCDGAVGRAAFLVRAVPVAAPPVAAPPPAPVAPRMEPVAPPAVVPSATAVLGASSPAPPKPGERSAAAPERSAPAAQDAAPRPPQRTAPADVAPADVAPVGKAVGTPIEKPVAKPERTAATRPMAGMWRWAVPAVAAAAIAVYVATRQAPVTSPGGNGSATQPVDSALVGGPSTPDTTRADSLAQRADSASPVVAGAADSVAPRADSTPAGPVVDAPVVAARIDLRPARPAAITPGQTVALAATVRDAGGASLRNARVTWESSDPRVATVDAARGTVRGIAPGAARITARAGDVTSRVTISVAPPAPDPSVVASIELSGVSPLTVGETARATAIARNASGTHVGSAGITWTSTDPDIATVASNGTITARAAGSTTIRATSGGQSADRVLTVRAREVAIRPDTPAGPPSNPGTPPTPRKTEAELRSEVQGVLETYARAIQTRDTSLIRRVFPSAGNDVLRRWQLTFDDAPGGIRMTGGAIQILDTPRDAAGAQVRARARYSASFHSRAARADQSFPVEFTASLLRGPDGSWRIVSMR